MNTRLVRVVPSLVRALIAVAPRALFAYTTRNATALRALGLLASFCVAPLVIAAMPVDPTLPAGR